jgi:hypothetical protein
MADETPAAVTSIEYGVRFADGTIYGRPTRESAEWAIKAVHGRHGPGRLVTRQVTTTPWTDTEESHDDRT